MTLKPEDLFKSIRLRQIMYTIVLMHTRKTVRLMALIWKAESFGGPLEIF